MSTTDTRAAFEALIANGPLSYLTAQRMDNGEYISKRTRAAWTAYQAATEAAKATGTAGELPPLPEAWYHGITEKHFEHAMYAYGQQCAEAARQSLMQLFLDPENQPTQYGTVLAARQPAPVVAVKPWHLRVDAQEGIDSEDAMQAEINECRAIIAKNVPVMAEQVDTLLIQRKKIQALQAEIADLRAALAATNRSQP